MALTHMYVHVDLDLDLIVNVGPHVLLSFFAGYFVTFVCVILFIHDSYMLLSSL